MKELPFTVRQETDFEKWRVETFWTKEPETIAWIDSFLPGESFLDVGANIGLYSLYAASKGCKVLAVEPHPGNFASLAINKRNNKHCSITPLRVAVGMNSEVGTFRCESYDAGSSDGGLIKKGRNEFPIGISSIDSLTKDLGPFDHIKIDVDGEEDLVVLGMCVSLREGAFKSCLIEVDDRNRIFILRSFENGRYSRGSRLNYIANHSRIRRTQEGIKVENIIFTRID
jgi:FkbM family methyltransferase